MLLQTKFLAPAYNTSSVDRSRLINRLDPRSARKLVLISAPAGFGKTTLVLQWLHSHDKSFSWLSLDDTDNNANRFWRYVVGAIATHIANFGDEAIALLDQQHPSEGAVTALINELSQWSLQGNQLTLVLDDFHVIDDQECLRTFAYFIDFLPPNVEIIITTRFEPALPISRWSVKNWVDKIYASDLTFSFEESKLFFNEYMGLALSEKQVEEIFSKTEGWIAAMQLTALSASGTPNHEQRFLPTARILEDDKYVSDYVISEILEHQPAELSEFMLESACLLRLNAGLCDTIRETDNSHELLKQLVAKNLFIIPMDKHNEWFRYHEIFRDALLSKLRASSPKRLLELQQKAVTWLVDHNQPHEAIEQAVLIKDWTLLADLLEKNGNNLIHEGHHLPVLQWLKHLPEQAVSGSPRLLMLKVWALFFGNKIEVIPPFLDELEALIDKQRIENIQTSAHELIDLHSEISLIRSYLARSQSDLRSANELTQQVLEELDNTNMPLKSVTYYGIGLDCFTIGDLESAESGLCAAIEHGKREKKYTTVLSSSGLLGWIYYYQGQLEIALETGIQCQQWIDSYQDPSQPRVISCWQNSCLAMIYMQRAEYTIAQSYINPLLKHITLGTEPGLHILIQYTYASFLFAQGEYVNAIERLEDAQSVYEHKKESIVFEPPSLSALKARCLMAMGQLEKAERVLNGLDSETINSIPLNFEDINLTKVRIFYAKGEYALAIEITERLIDQTREKRHTFHLIQALCLKGLCLLKQGEKQKAQTAINESISMASKEGFVAVYTNEHKDITKLLALSNESSVQDTYLQKLSSGMGLKQDQNKTEDQLPGAAAFENNIQLLEPLSQRELEVLGLIDEGLANKEIAQKLSLAPATVKAHIRNLYGKIAAKSRTEALSKARQIGLI